MKIIGILLSLFILTVIVGVGYVALSDVPITQTTITRDLSTENIK